MPAPNNESFLQQLASETIGGVIFAAGLGMCVAGFFSLSSVGIGSFVTGFVWMAASGLVLPSLWKKYSARWNNPPMWAIRMVLALVILVLSYYGTSYLAQG